MKSHLILALACVLPSMSSVAIGSESDTIEIFEMASDASSSEFQLSYEQSSSVNPDDEQTVDSMLMVDDEIDVSSTSY